MARDLPSVVLERIFHHLDPEQLLTVRLVCHRWKTTADRKRSLWNRICIKLPRNASLDHRFRLKNCAPATCIRLDRAKILTVNSWWPERFTCVELGDCNVALGTFLGMLRRTPNLRQLVMRYTNYSGSRDVTVDFQLDRLEELELYFDELLEVFVRIFPKLRKFSYDYPETWHDDVRDRLIQSVQGTLKDLEFYPTADLLQKMATMERLQLRRVKLFTFMQDHDEHDAVWLSRIQPTIEELIMSGVVAKSSTLSEIGHNLPQLKTLDTKVEAEHPTFLTAMPNLETITLRGQSDVYSGIQPIDLRDVSHPNLKHAEFWYSRFEQTSLQSFLTGCPNLTVLSINWCDLSESRFNRSATSQLTSLSLNAMDSLNPRVTLRKLCRTLPLLNRLRIENCDTAVTVDVAERVLHRWPTTFRWLEIGCPEPGTYEEVRKLLRSRCRGGISTDRGVVLYSGERKSSGKGKIYYGVP